ncbi:MAG: hypothetical protein LJE92_01450 [Gammaproteobacteria bacterium]|jgi:hypothetical protein|nr:hypothetical protein [Gammaproteobacteria bacterium]
MFEDEQKLRLIAAAVKLRDIIATLEVDLEYQALIDFCGSSGKLLTYGVHGLVSNAEFQDAGEDALTSCGDDHNALFTALNQTVYDIGKLVDLH